MRKRTVIEADGSGSSDIIEILRYKDLLFTLAYRDLRVRYAQTLLGLLWAFIQPALMLGIFTVLFGRALDVDTGGVPYPLYACAGLIAWTFFAYVMANAGGSIIGSQAMIKKIYFPRLIVPLSKALVGLVDFGVTFLIFLALALSYGHSLTLNVLGVPLFVVAAIVAGLAVGIWLSALTVRYRDFQHVIPFLVQIGLWVTPVAYPARMLPEKLLPLYFLNPAAGVVDGLRWCLLGTPAPDPHSALSLGVGALLFVTSIGYFRRVEREMADIV